MNSLSLSHIWVMRFWFLAISLIIIFFHLIPLETAPRKWAPPDLLIALALAWTARRPDFVPTLSVAAVMLMADLLFQRPPGLMSLLLVLGCEYVRSRSVGHGETSFLAEWFIVCFAIVAMTLLDRLVLAIMLVERAPLSLHLIQMVLTMAVYPLVALFSETVLGVRKLAPGNAEIRGLR